MSETQTNLKKVSDLALKGIALGALQKPLELSNLLKFLKKKSLKTIVEIGTAKGGTFYTLCQIAPDNAKVISLDLPGGPFGGGYTEEDIKRFKTYKRGRQKLYFLRKDSHLGSTKMELESVLGKNPIDLLVIDGDHTLAGVKRDWDLYSPLVKDRGLVVFHDIVPHPATPACQVFKLWDELKTKYKHVEIIDSSLDPNQWAGVGIIYYRQDGISLSSKKGILLNISPLLGKEKGFVGLGNRSHPNVDIIHDLEDIPWPLEDNSCHLIVGQYVLQKIKPWLIVDVMNEIWRILKPDGQLAISVPYAGSPAFYSDPKNMISFNEDTFLYFDPQKNLSLYSIYEPKPWQVEKGFPQWAANGTIEVLMRPRKNEKGKL